MLGADNSFLCYKGKNVMPSNSKQSSTMVAKLASETLRDPHASAIAKSLAASTLAQANTGKQTSAEMEAKAGRVLQSEKYSEETKTLAGSVVSQANKARGE
jgi:hypothetical protein